VGTIKTSSPTKIILGVDPGTLVTGYGVLEAKNGNCRVLALNVIKNRSTLSMPARLQTIYSTLCDVITQFHPDEFAIETAFYGKNAQSALKIGHARGVSILAAVNHGIHTTEYSPREIKKAVVGNGAASKSQVQYMIKSLLNIRSSTPLFDASDALAVALCHFHRMDRPRTVGRVTKKKQDSWKAFVTAHPERVR
jgi:crossover junction endodeoxyribonuclease RuvC